MGAGNSHKASPDCAGAMFSSPLRMTTVARTSTPTSGNYAIYSLARMPSKWNATIFLTACNSLREDHIPFEIFDFFNFSILNHIASYPSTTAHPMTSWYLSSLDMDHPNHRSIYSQVIPNVAIAASLSLPFGHTENKSLAFYGTLQDSITRWNTGNERFDWLMYVA